MDTIIDDLEGVCNSYSDGYHYIDYEFSCDFCEYREVCRMDERIDGYRLQELTSLTDEERKEAMERAVYGGSEEGHRDEK